jgi:tryptophan synthase alpha chain
MSSARLSTCLERAATTPERMLVLYWTLGDPLTDPAELVEAAVDGGADALELGLPTRSTRPRGDEIRASFDRALAAGAGDVWSLCRRVRAIAPDRALLPLVYAETIADLGLDALLDGASAAGMDGLVLVEPSASLLERVSARGLAAVPVIRPGAEPGAVAELEEKAALTYRALAGQTGAALDLERARADVAALAASARRPFLLGFGIRRESELRALAPRAAGFVIGSELLRLLRAESADRRAEAMRRAVAAWKAAAVEKSSSS